MIWSLWQVLKRKSQHRFPEALAQGCEEFRPSKRLLGRLVATVKQTIWPLGLKGYCSWSCPYETHVGTTLYDAPPPQPSPSNDGTFNCGSWEYHPEASGSVSSHRKEPCQNLKPLRWGRLQPIAGRWLVRRHSTAFLGWTNWERSTQPPAQRQTGCAVASPTPPICLLLFASTSPYSSPKKSFYRNFWAQRMLPGKLISGITLASNPNFQTKWVYQPGGSWNFVVTSLLLISGK